MPYPTEDLGPDEEIVLDLKPHWWFLTPRLAVLVLAVVVGVAVRWNIDNTAVQALAGIVILVALGWFGIRFARWMTTSFVVTTHKLIYRSGLLHKSGVEIPLNQINTVVFNQRLFERIIGAGDIEVESAGETPQKFTDVRRPTYVQAEINRQKDAQADRRSRPVAAAAGLSVAEQLEKLDDLRAKGVLDEAEFQAQKQALLGGSGSGSPGS